MKFTGERYIPGAEGPIEVEHLHRYTLSKSLTTAKTVLDIACGEGYGSHLMSQNALHVTGVDISAESIRHARAKYNSSNLEFKVGDCAKIPLPEHSVDIVVSFETIEHHDQHEAMMLEIKRVLKPDGLLIISSPDKKTYSDLRNYKNPFHVKELYKEEFRKLLTDHFKNTTLYGQRVVLGSVITQESTPYSLEHRTLSTNGEVKSNNNLNAWYHVAVASDAQLPKVETSLFESDLDHFTSSILRPEKENAIQQIGYRDRLIGELTKQIEDEKRNAENQIHHRDKLIDELRLQLEDEKRNAESEIHYRDKLANELRLQLEDEKRNAENQIHHRDKLIDELRLQLEDEKRNAYEQISYRNELIAHKESTINQLTNDNISAEQRIATLNKIVNSKRELLKLLWKRKLDT